MPAAEFTASASVSEPLRTRLGRKRIYILPTRYGVIFGLVLLVMLLGSANYNSSLGYVLTFLLSSLALVCLLHTYRNLAGITLDGGRVMPVFASQNAEFKLCFDNREGPQRYALELSRHRLRSLRQLWSKQTREADWQGELQAGHLQTLSLICACDTRGTHALGRLSLSSSFPLGLFRAWSYLDSGLSVVVYPRPAGNAPLPYETDSRRSGLSGVQEGVDDFVGFRDYYPGDSPKYISWKSYARNHELVIKRFSGVGAEMVVLGWDQLFYLPDTEVRLSQLTQWVLDADAAGLQYSLQLPGVSIPAGNGDLHRRECLTRLALYAL